MGPTGDIHLVNSLVADLAVAIVPKPVPVVMDVKAWLISILVDQEWPLPGRALPKCPIQIGWNRSGCAVANRVPVAVLVDDSPRVDDLSDESFVD